MSLQTDSAVPPGISFEPHVLASRMPLYTKLFRIHQDFSAGKLSVDGASNIIAQKKAQAKPDGPLMADIHSLPGIGGAEVPSDVLPGLTAYPPTANIPSTFPQQTTQPPVNDPIESGREASPEDGEILPNSTPAFDPVLLQKSDALIQAEKKLEQERASRGGHPFLADGQGKSLKIVDSRDYPYIDVRPIFAAAQALVPPVSGVRASSAKTFNTESLYSSRGSWSARASVDQVLEAPVPGLVHEASNASAAMEISSNEDSAEGQAIASRPQPIADENDYSPENLPITYHQRPPTPPNATPTSWTRKEATGRLEPAQSQASRAVPQAIEILTDDEHIVDSVQNASKRPPYGGNVALHDESTSSRSEVAVQPIDEEDDYEPESEDEYEPPSAGAFDTGESNTRPVKPIKPYPMGAKPHQKARKNLRPRPAKKRRRLDYPADPRQRVQQQYAQDSPPQSYTGQSSSESFIKQEPVSPPPLLPPERIPLPETPPSVRRRYSGYGSDLNGYDSSDRGMGPSSSFYDRDGQIVRRKRALPPDVRATGAGTYHQSATEPSTALVPYGRGRRDELMEISPNVSRTMAVPAPPAHDALRIIAIGSHTGKVYYNRQLRPGDTIPAPGPDVPRIDDAPKVAAPLAAVADMRAMSAYPEPRRTMSLHDRLYAEPPAPQPEHRAVSYGSAARAYSAYPEPAPPRAYSVYPEETATARYETPPYAREEYERREARQMAYEYAAARAYYTARPEHVPAAESEPSYSRTYSKRPELAIAAAPERTYTRAHSMRAEYAVPAAEPSYTYEHGVRSSTARPEPRQESTALASFHERAAEYWAKPPVPDRVFKDPYPPRTHASATFHRSQSVNPVAYDPAASIQAYAVSASSSSSRAMMPPPPPPIHTYAREYSHQPRHASAAPWQ